MGMALSVSVEQSLLCGVEHVPRRAKAPGYLRRMWRRKGGVQGIGSGR